MNERIRENQSVSTYEIPFEEAQNRPEIKQFFGEKYAAHVRVVDINYSKELCGGTHAYHVGMLGYFRITKESSIAAGVRRIEASCGRAAEKYVREEEALLFEAASLVKAQVPKLTEKVSQLIDENTELKRQVRSLKRSGLNQLTEQLVKRAEKGVLTSLVEVDSEDLTELADLILQKLQSGVVAIALKQAERIQLGVKVSPDYVKKGIAAGDLIKEISSLIDGRGGGRADSAQAGGKNPAGIEEAFNHIKKLVAQK